MTKEFFFRRAHSINEKSPEHDSTFVLNEFNHNIPLGKTTYKDKKLLFR
jgi:hypothetical protein